ncbi:Eukaryotic translation initiation factor 2 subunit gamma, partial [Nosema bombycis CQ1]
MVIIRSFDINKPGTSIPNLSGGVVGGSLVTGCLNLNDEIEIRPGLISKKDKTFTCQPFITRVVSLKTEDNPLEVAYPGGLIGVGTEIDPFFCKSDRLVGQVMGRKGQLPPIFTDIEVEYTLFQKTTTQDKQKFKEDEHVLLNIGKELPEKTEINSIQDLNLVLNFLKVNTKINNDLISFLLALSKESPDILNPVYISKLKEDEDNFIFLKKCEEECDLLEVTLANLKKQHSEYENLNKNDIKMLENQLYVYNQKFNDVQFEAINMDILKGVYAFMQGEPVEGDIVNSLAYVKELEGFELLIKKYEDNPNLLFNLISKNEFTKVDDICNLMGNDRLETLNLLYLLQGADLITFDSQNGTIRLKK